MNGRLIRRALVDSRAARFVLLLLLLAPLEIEVGVLAVGGVEQGAFWLTHLFSVQIGGCSCCDVAQIYVQLLLHGTLALMGGVSRCLVRLVLI